MITGLNTFSSKFPEAPAAGGAERSELGLYAARPPCEALRTMALEREGRCPTLTVELYDPLGRQESGSVRSYG